MEKGQIQYINIQGWMIYDLGLKGNELLLYAMIYGYTQDGRNTYHGSLSYIAKGLNISRRNSINILQKLQEKGLIIKTKDSHYMASENSSPLVKKVHQTSEKSSLLASEKSSHNNNKEIIINNNNKEIIKEKINFSLLLQKNINSEFIEKIKSKFELENDFIKNELENFVIYWTEKNPNGKKEKWQMQKTFDIQKRFYTWIKRSKDWTRQQKESRVGENIETVF